MNKPKISVVIPIFNAETYLRKCLDSIVNQTYQEIEIILVNDGSTDKSNEIIQEYIAEDSRIVYIQKDNGGIGTAYKAAFEVMTGDYVSFVDSDDYIEIETYEELYKNISETNAEIIQFGIFRFNESGKVYATELPINKATDGNSEILYEHFTSIKTPSLACRIFRSDLFKEVHIPNQSVGIDEIIYIQLITKCNKYVSINNAFYHVYHRQGSISRNSYNATRIHEGILAHIFIIDHIRNSSCEYNNYAYLKYVKYIMFLRVELYKGNSRIAREVYAELMKDFLYYYSLLDGSKEMRNERLIVRIAFRIFKMHPNSYIKLMSMIP